MDGLFLNQKTNNNIRISYSLKYNHSKKEYILYEKINDSVDEIKESSINKNSSSTMAVMICTRATFVKKNSCLVVRMVPYYNVVLHLLTFYYLEPYQSIYIALGLSHIISHQWRYYSTF